MKLTLEQITRNAQAGSLKGKEEILKVLNGLLGTPVKELPHSYTDSLKGMLSCGLRWIENVSDEKYGEYTYLDLICLAYLTADALIREDPENGQSSMLLLSEYVFLTFLQKTAHCCAWTDLFYAVNLKELLDALDELSGLPQQSFDEVIKLTHGLSEDSSYMYSLTPESTVKDLIDQTNDVIKHFWRPWHDIKTFSDDVMVGYKVIYRVVFGSILTAHMSRLRDLEFKTRLAEELEGEYTVE